MSILKVEGLCKTYPGFMLRDVSFELREGTIMGFIGRNGAGKSTTMKAILNIVHADKGTIEYFGESLYGHETGIKNRIGYAGGAADYYKRKKLKDIVSVTRIFYDRWDDNEYRKYMEAFSIDENKTVSQLSAGMKVKFSLVLALSHHAEILILDEPTSGLDPVSREELLDTFRFLKDHGVSILFSTHITSDLEKCADDITYIANGRIIATGDLKEILAGCAERGEGTDLDEIMVYHEKESLYEKLT